MCMLLGQRNLDGIAMRHTWLFVPASALLVAVTALSACQQEEIEPGSTLEETLKTFAAGDLEVPESVSPGEAFEVKFPDEPLRETRYGLYRSFRDTWVLDQFLLVAKNPDDTPTAVPWEKGAGGTSDALQGGESDKVALLGATKAGTYLLCQYRIDPRLGESTPHCVSLQVQ